MDSQMLLHCVIDPACDLLMLSGIKRDPRADRMLIAIGLQETGLKARRQYALGPARGWWQFEQTGLAGVLEHRTTKVAARRLMHQLELPAGLAELHSVLEFSDIAAAAFARLLLWSDPGSLPDDERAGWQMYLRTWRPGKPHPGTWPGAWLEAHNTLLYVPDPTPPKGNQIIQDNVIPFAV